MVWLDGRGGRLVIGDDFDISRETIFGPWSMTSIAILIQLVKEHLSQLDRLYLAIVTAVDDLVTAVGLKIAA
jgi:hypothetical protein